ncbi:MAG: CBO0543 family protein [Bacillota bacterium]|nr:CBO0543 family protein [Bacillota bacterium]
MDYKEELGKKIFEMRKSVLHLTIEHWYSYELFTWQWWIKFVYLLIPIFIFFKLLDRKRIFEIMIYGLMLSLLSTVTDVVGVYYLLWDYSIRLIPSGFFQVHDLFVIPIVSMLIYQYFTEWKPFIIANLIVGAIGGYLKEPLYMWVKIYKPINWSHTYSFILYFVIAIICRYVIDKIKNSYEKSLT